MAELVVKMEQVSFYFVKVSLNTFFLQHFHIGIFHFAVQAAKIFLQAQGLLTLVTLDYFNQVKADPVEAVNDRTGKLFIEKYLVCHVLVIIVATVTF